MNWLGDTTTAWGCRVLVYFCLCVAGSAQTNTLVYEDVNGVLQYGTYANEGDTIKSNTVPDFSNCGYKGGGEPIPFVPAMVTINAPTGGDDTALIQNAIDTVAGMSVGPNGFRGAVLIKAGNYQVGSTINITSSGIVIRGDGSQATGGTKITMTATVQDNLFQARGSGSPSEVGGTRVSITDSFVPSGSTSFNVSDATGYNVGDQIRIHYKMNAAWISAIKMDVLTLHPSALPDDVDWAAANYQLYYERTITAKSGNAITINAPLVQAIESQYGGADIFKYTFSGQISNIGFEGLRLESSYSNNDDEAHGWIAINLQDLRDSWVRQVTVKYFGYSAVSFSAECHYVTIEDCAMVDPKSITTGGRKYSFNINGSAFVLMQRCYTWGGRHDYVSGSKVGGPNVFVDCLAENTFSDVGPHHRYSTGQLYDNVKCGKLHVQNRGVSGTGHGWSGAQIMAWNSVAPELRCDAPVGAMNWNIGCIGAKLTKEWADPAYPDNFGIWESLGAHVTPRSLYYRQLQERMGADALRNVILPPQDSGSIWAELGAWAGDGLFGDDVVAWASPAFVTPPDSVSLKGLVRNLQMLDNGATSQWSKVTGPGTVSFGDATALDTTASFTTVGSYVLRLTVDDGVTTASYDLNVRYGNTAPVVVAGTNQTVALGGAVPWTPAEIATAAWYDASDTNTISASGGSVSEWRDKSANGHDLAQTTPASQPTTASRAINGINVLDFDGNDSVFNDTATAVSGNPDLMIASVRFFDANVSGNDMILTLGNGTGGQTACISGGSNGYSWRFFNGFESYGAVTTNIAAIQIGTRSAGTDYAGSQMWLNGIELARAAGSGDTTFPNLQNGVWVCGKGGYVDGAIAEIIVLQDVTLDTRQKVEGYLAHKWGITNSIPGGHPYKTVVPGTPTATALLGATVTDPEADPFTVSWTLQDGPAAVTFANAAATNTTVTFTTNGVYNLRLSADDGFGVSYDDVVITVTNGVVSGFQLWLVDNGLDAGMSETELASNGVSTLLEAYIAGLDPTNAASRFVIQTLGWQADDPVLQWSGVTGRLYSVFWSSNLLNGGGFELIGSNIPWNSSTFTDTNTVHQSEAKGFYRIGVQLE